MSNRPICFVSIPFGKKTSRMGGIYDFDRIYSEAIRPAGLMAGVDTVRGELEPNDPFEKRRLEHLVVSPVFIADVTTGNPHIYYDIGIRHAAKQRGTIIIAAHSERGVPAVFSWRPSFVQYKEENGTVSDSTLEEFKKQLAQMIALEIGARTQVSRDVLQRLFESAEVLRAPFAKR